MKAVEEPEVTSKEPESEVPLSSSALQDPRLVPRELRAPKVFSLTPASPDKPVRNFGSFAQFLSSIRREVTIDSDADEPRVTEEYASSEAPSAVESDIESGVHPRSTLAQVLIPPKTQDETDCLYKTSEATVEDLSVEPSGLDAFSISSREIIKKYFSETKVIRL